MIDAHHATVFLEDAAILAHEPLPGEQYLLRLHAPQAAAIAQPGSFAHLQCDRLLPLRRPISIMRAAEHEGWIELLYRAVGKGTRLLAEKRCGETLSVMAPIGRPFAPRPDRPRALLIGGGIGIPPMIFLADVLRIIPGYRPFLLAGSESPFAFSPRPSRIIVAGLPAGVTAALPLLDDWGVPSRLASLEARPGCHQGYVTDLARAWLESLDEVARAEVMVFACGPHPMLEAVARLSREFGLPCEVSMEEFMACGIGGCAGCVVEVATPTGTAMQRVCVDGPVFPAEAVFT